MKKLILTTLAGLTLGIPVFAATDVVPNGYENQEAGGGFSPPLSSGEVHYQQLYDASQFQPLLPGGALITEIRFRTDGPLGNSFNATLQDVEIRLSTSTRNVAGMSKFFADNTGADETIVYPRGSLPFTGTHSGITGPKSFSVVIPLPKPFYYNPAAGNLLFDYRNYGRPPQDGSLLDAWTSEPSPFALIKGGINSDQSDIGLGVAREGLVTQFVFVSVPEPSTFVLIAFGSWPLFLIRKRPRAEVNFQELETQK